MGCCGGSKVAKPTRDAGPSKGQAVGDSKEADKKNELKTDFKIAVHSPSQTDLRSQQEHEKAKEEEQAKSKSKSTENPNKTKEEKKEEAPARPDEANHPQSNQAEEKAYTKKAVQFAGQKEEAKDKLVENEIEMEIDREITRAKIVSSQYLNNLYSDMTNNVEQNQLEPNESCNFSVDDESDLERQKIFQKHVNNTPQIARRINKPQGRYQQYLQRDGQVNIANGNHHHEWNANGNDGRFGAESGAGGGLAQDDVVFESDATEKIKGGSNRSNPSIHSLASIDSIGNPRGKACFDHNGNPPLFQNGIIEIKESGSNDIAFQNDQIDF